MARSADHSRAPPTYADIEALPEHLTGEIVDGELIVSPRPSPPHILTASALGVFLGGPFQYGMNGPGGWWILDEPELHLGPDVLVPDLAGWRRERMPAMPDSAWFEIAPDWVCEVLSPSTVRVDRVKKLSSYARERVAHVWLVDPVARLLEVFRLEGEVWLRTAAHGPAEEPVRIEPFEAVALDLGLLWPGEEAVSG